ncbi:MAG: DUF1553 domain-containing protein [Planctomycetales bacterium]
MILKRWFKGSDMPTARLLIVCWVCSGVAIDSVASAEINFDRDVAPILVKRCLECHSEHEAMGGLVLTTRANVLKGGEGGAAFSLTKPQESLLLQRVVAGEMPPEQRGASRKLPDEEIRILSEWVAEGAQWPDGRTLDQYESTSDVRGGRDWWSLQPVVRPAVPEVAPVRDNPIDAFIAAKLATHGFEPAPVADRRTLIRRLYYDVVGLPPTYEQTESFVADESPDAWRTLVDSLLDSPHHGERWGRYWLDVVRYAETSGYERDQDKPFAWKYRDWVIDALNSDMPYDEFVIHQLAGDEIPNRDIKSVTATGFLMLGTWNDEPNDNQDYKYERLEDLVHTTSSAFLGLTVKCARCHDHKFDPIPQVDYYRMASVFLPGPIEARDRKLIGGPSAEELGFSEVLGWTDLTASPASLHVLKNGSRHTPLQAVTSAPLTAIPALFKDFEPPLDGAATTQRRLQLARWIASPDNPLTARVLVNRMWQHHFGQGLVRSPNSFGFRGDPPTHPKLLDWLAAEFVSGGWTLKRMHRLILNSDTWRQSTTHAKHEEYSQTDSSNRLLWRADRRRLDAEALRDSFLASAGQLDLRLGGASFRPKISPEALEGLSRKASAWTESSAEEQKRRSIYIYMKRHLLPPLMTTFDLCDTTLPNAKRDVTTVAPQALALLNNSFSHDQSTALAGRIAALTKSPVEQADLVWRFALSREATSLELSLAASHMKKQSAEFKKEHSTSIAVEWRSSEDAISSEDLVLHLRADAGVNADESGRIFRWMDQSEDDHDATQSESAHGPLLVHGVKGRPVVRFDGSQRFLDIDGQLLKTAECSIFAVVSDKHSGGHREIISNWKRGENVGSSVFLGLTGDRQVRFSDAFSNAGSIADRDKLFVLSAINSANGTDVFQNATMTGRSESALPNRKLDTSWVIGQQGNINGEYWNGDIAELLVYDRALSTTERRQVWSVLLDRYQLPTFVRQATSAESSPELLALASLCHVLLNSNEFIYVD